MPPGKDTTLGTLARRARDGTDPPAPFKPRPGRGPLPPPRFWPDPVKVSPRGQIGGTWWGGAGSEVEVRLFLGLPKPPVAGCGRFGGRRARTTPPAFLLSLFPPPSPVPRRGSDGEAEETRATMRVARAPPGRAGDVRSVARAPDSGSKRPVNHAHPHCAIRPHSATFAGYGGSPPPPPGGGRPPPLGRLEMGI